MSTQCKESCTRHQNIKKKKQQQKTGNTVNEEYLPFLYLGGYYLSPLLYDVNEKVTLLQQLGFLSGCIYLQTRRKRAGDAF